MTTPKKVNDSFEIGNPSKVDEINESSKDENGKAKMKNSVVIGSPIPNKTSNVRRYIPYQPNPNNIPKSVNNFSTPIRDKNGK